MSDDWQVLQLRENRRMAIDRLVHAVADIADEFRTMMIAWGGDNYLGKVGISTADRARICNAIDDLERVLWMDEPPVDAGAAIGLSVVGAVS